MASMNGGHFLTVICSVCRTVLKAFCGIVLNQSGSPSTAGIGRGRIGSNSGGQRNVTVMGLMLVWSIIGFRAGPGRGHCGYLHFKSIISGSRRTGAAPSFLGRRHVFG